MKKALELNKKFRDEVKKDKEVIAALVFGSYVRGESYNDIDLCLVLDKKYANSKMTGKRLKYLSNAPNKFDIQIFQQLPIYIRKKILEEGKVLFCANERRLYEISFDTINEFEDFKEIYKNYIKNAVK